MVTHVPQAYYSIADLCRYTRHKFTRWTMKRALDRMGVQYMRMSPKGKVYIARSEVLKVWPRFFDEIQEFSDEWDEFVK